VRVAVVAVGDELLLGDVVNRNLSWLGGAFAAAGLDVVRGFEVGDDVPAMLDVLRSALQVADAVVVTGGLGPTSDDRTRQAVAALAGVGLRRDPELVAGLQRWYADRGRVMPPGVAVQGDRPEGARTVPNAAGTAPGLVIEVGGRPVYCVPGVPAELAAMVAAVVVPELRARAGLPVAVRTEQLRVAVVGESAVAQRLEPVAADLPDGVRMSYLASLGEVRVRFTGTDPDLLGQVRDRAAALLGNAVSGRDQETLAATVLRLLVEGSTTVAVAESLTGGLLVSALVDVPGSSAALRGGVVAYASQLKTELLDVPADLLDLRGAVDPQVALLMAQGVRARLGTGWGIAATGVAGPDAQDGHAPGTVFVAVAGERDPDGTVVGLALRGDRPIVRALSVVNALDLFRRRLLGLPASGEQPW
jgi:nicotinamide-nucleotide amidase